MTVLKHVQDEKKRPRITWLPLFQNPALVYYNVNEWKKKNPAMGSLYVIIKSNN